MRVAGVGGIFNIETPRCGEGVAMSSKTGWEDTVEHVDPFIDGKFEIFRLSEPHDILRFIVG